MVHSALRFFSIPALLLLLVTVSFGDDGLPVVLFDQGHNQRFVIEETGDLQLSKLAGVIRSAGMQTTSTKVPLNDEQLEKIASLVLSGPFDELKAEEVDAIIRFMERGGRVAIMLHIGSPLTALLNRLDVDHSNSVLHERKNVIDSDINFIVKDITTHPLFNGLNQFSAYGAWALKAGTGSESLARTSPDAWIDLNGDRILSKGDAIGAFDIVVNGTKGAGSFMIFGDDAIFQNRYLDDNNSRLAENLGGWLSGR